jgi:hypothetical protein
MVMGRGLSPEQRQVLFAVAADLQERWDYLHDLEAAASEDPEGFYRQIPLPCRSDPGGYLTMLFVHLRVQGVEWRSGARDGSGRASMSRTLRRLERRGLVVRRNWISGGDRTTNVSLTVAGWEEVGRLTDDDVSHLVAFYRASARADEKEPRP